MTTTQDHIPIKDIADDILFLKDGGGALVLQVSAVNFGLLSEREQVAIISAFARMLNSLSFSVQIVIHSKRLNISSYLNLLDNARSRQSNPLLSQMIASYRQFIQALIKENEVLDKKFYVIIPLFKLELGLVTSTDSLKQKIKTILLPRQDQLVRQLQRVGLKAQQLGSEKLIELFFDIYNEATLPSKEESIHKQQAILKNPPPEKVAPQPPPPIQPPAQSPLRPSLADEAGRARTHPFIVEELEEG